MNVEESQDEIQRRIAACVNALEGIPTDRIEGKNLGEILAGEMRLHGAGPRSDGGFGFEFSGGVCQLLAEAYAEQFKQSGAINYLELLFQHSEIGPLTITMQRVDGLTPAQKLAQAENERDSLAAKVKQLEWDSVFIPKDIESALAVMGVALPESKEEFNFSINRWVQRLVDRVIRVGPELDAERNNLRAEGVDKAIAHLHKKFEGTGHIGVPVMALESLANQLRAGKDGE